MHSVQEAAAWCNNAAAWVDSVMTRFPEYIDLLQPLALAILEIRAGLGLLMSASKEGAPVASSGRHAERPQKVSQALRTLMEFPRSLQPPANLGSPSFQGLLVEVVRASVPAAGDAGSQTRSEVAAYTVRVEGLRAAAHAAARWAALQGPNGTAAETVHELLSGFVRLWEELKAEEERQATEEAALFKTKTRQNNILSETVSFL